MQIHSPTATRTDGQTLECGVSPVKGVGLRTTTDVLHEQAKVSYSGQPLNLPQQEHIQVKILNS